MSLVALDIDGVCADFANAANRWLAAASGKAPKAIEQWNWYVKYPDGERLWKQFWRHVDRSDFWLTLKPEPYAVQGAWELKEAGHEVEYCTSRNEKYREQTEAWLVEQGFPMEDGSLGHFKDKTQSPWDVLIDDHKGHVEAARNAGREAVLMLQPWNVSFALYNPLVPGITSLTDPYIHALVGA